MLPGNASMNLLPLLLLMSVINDQQPWYISSLTRLAWRMALRAQLSSTSSAALLFLFTTTSHLYMYLFWLTPGLALHCSALALAARQADTQTHGHHDHSLAGLLLFDLLPVSYYVTISQQYYGTPALSLQHELAYGHHQEPGARSVQCSACAAELGHLAARGKINYRLRNEPIQSGHCREMVYILLLSPST